MASLDVRFWGFFTLGLLSLMLVMGALALWWQSRERARSAQRLPRWQAHPSIHSTSQLTSADFPIPRPDATASRKTS